MKRGAIYLFGLLLMIEPAYAQDDAAPWPPDPSVIFTDIVEIVDVEIVEPTPIEYLPDEREGESVWIIQNSEDNAQSYLYNTSTGELSDPLPGELIWLDMPRPTVSLDGEWVALIADDPQDPNYRNVLAYSYQIDTGQLRQLGVFVAWDRISFERWVDSQIIIVTSDMPEYQNRFLYIADAAQADSLEFALSRFRFYPDYYDDPPRFEFVSGTEGADGPLRCEWVRYDISSRQLETYDLGTLCEPVKGKLGETAYYLDNGEFRSPTRILVRFNPLTGEREDLFEGEIEDVIGVSTDEKYATLVLDDNGRIDMGPDWNSQENSPQNPRLAEVNLQTDEVLFSIEAGWVWDWDIWYSYPQSRILRLDEQEYLAYQVDSAYLFHACGESFIDHVTLHENGIQQTRIADSIEFASYRYNQILWWDLECGNGQVSTRVLQLFNLLTNESRQITYPVQADVYEIRAWFGSDDHIIVYLNHLEKSNPAYIYYTLRIPPPDETP